MTIIRTKKGQYGPATAPERKQSVYKGAYSPDFDESNLMGSDAKLWGQTSGPGYDPAMSYYNPAETAADHRAGKTGKNTQVPHAQEFQDDTVAPHGAVSPDYHVMGGFPGPVSKSSNHPRYRKQPK